jgi:hypothetical protein
LGVVSEAPLGQRGRDAARARGRLDGLGAAGAGGGPALEPQARLVSAARRTGPGATRACWPATVSAGSPSRVRPDHQGNLGRTGHQQHGHHGRYARRREGPRRS